MRPGGLGAVAGVGWKRHFGAPEAEASGRGPSTAGSARPGPGPGPGGGGDGGGVRTDWVGGRAARLLRRSCSVAGWVGRTESGPAGPSGRLAGRIWDTDRRPVRVRGGSWGDGSVWGPGEGSDRSRSGLSGRGDAGILRDTFRWEEEGGTREARERLERRKLVAGRVAVVWGTGRLGVAQVRREKGGQGRQGSQ